MKTFDLVPDLICVNIAQRLCDHQPKGCVCFWR